MLPAVPSHCVLSIHDMGAQQEPEWVGVSMFNILKAILIRHTVGYAKHEGSQHPHQVTLQITQYPSYKPVMGSSKTDTPTPLFLAPSLS